MKPVVWLGGSKADLKAFPAAIVDDMGHQLFLVQCGHEPDDWKPMTTVESGVKEIRMRDVHGAFRTISHCLSGGSVGRRLCDSLFSKEITADRSARY